jgi:glycerophosphoryl diester phosphodiesterase
MNSFERFTSNIVSLFFSSLPQYRPTEATLNSVKLVAHRGIHEDNLATENTLPAFHLAKHNHIWGIELDVRMTSDHVPVVHHDPDCGRLFDHPEILIGEITFQELREKIPQIPTLQEVLKLTDQKTHLLIEIKEDYRQLPSHVQILKDVLQPLTPLKDYHLISLNPEFLEAFDFCPSSAKLDVYWFNKSEIIQKNYELGHGAVAGYFLFMSTREIKALHLDKKKIGVGFIESRNSLFRELNRGADYIFTNHALKLKKYLT